MRWAGSTGISQQSRAQNQWPIILTCPNNFSNKLNYIIFIEEKNMGHQHFRQLQHRLQQTENADTLQLPTPFHLFAALQKHVQEITQQELTLPLLKQHLFQYIKSQAQNKNYSKKRRRSYQLLQIQQQSLEKTRSRSDSFSTECTLLDEKTNWLEEIQEQVLKNIAEVTVSQKSYKIRQSFRKLMLGLLKLDNLYMYVLHATGRLEFHDFKANYMTYLMDSVKQQNIQLIIKKHQQEAVGSEILEIFNLADLKGQEELFRWGVNTEDPRFRVCYLGKNYRDGQVGELDSKVIKKIADIAMIQSVQQEQNAIIQIYAKEMLDLLQLCICQSQPNICSRLSLGFRTLQEMHKSLSNSKEKNQPLLTRVRSYQQLQFQLLECIRTYKKYVCEGDKIFMDFNESAELTFISNNFNHPLMANFAKISESQKYYLQRIFQNYKPINDFLRKAVQTKIKNNKFYELDGEAKARVKYDEEGRIVRLNVIIQETERSSSSGSNIFCSSSTKILSEESQKQSLDDLPEQQLQLRKRSPSSFMRSLEKQNPGIINEGWINLFVKDHHITCRKNNLIRGKTGKLYTSKRSYSLNHDSIIQTDEPKNKEESINIQSIDLNLLELQEEQLQPLVFQVFRQLDYFHTDHINKQFFQNFVGDIHKGYKMHKNPFHNFTHGVNVMHTCYILSQAAKVRQILNPFKLFTVIFSGLCHDVGHTGFTNLFEIASHSKKAITYNDDSPLQNFHAAYTFQLLKKPENNFLKDLSAEEAKQFRKSVINNILFTDIKEHFPLLKKFNALIKDQIPKNDDYVDLLTSMIVHTADFGGSAKEFEICKAWSLKVNLQFSNQYTIEGQLGLAQTPFMKDLTNITILSKNQGGFLKVIVFPLYEAIDTFCGTDLRVGKLRQYAQLNIKRWEEIHLKSVKEQKQKNQKADKKESDIKQVK